VGDQLDSIDSSFPEKFLALDYTVGHIQTEYLKLDIGERERLTVESIKTLQSELGVAGLQVFEWLRSGKMTDARNQLAAVERTQKEIQERFDELHDLQMDKLQSIQNQLNQSVSTSFLTVYGLAGGVLLTLAIFISLLRRRVILPVKSLHQATTRIRDGDFSARASISQSHEIGQVARGFNFMAESLAQSYADLERKVADRTREVQQLQQDIVQTAKMSAVGQMISGVAHELNNPLTVIMGFTELRRNRLSKIGGDPDELKLMEELYSQSDRCRKIVANLLQFARKVTPEIEAIWLNDLIDQVLGLREYEFKTRNVVFVREYATPNPKVYADKNGLQQVLLNLINNAYDSICDTHRAGTIWIRTNVLGERVSIEILDDGTGIRDPERVFEPFYTTKEVGKGTGLGLGVCYGIVKEHNGEITADNWERGARFTVTIPFGTKPESSRSKLSADEPSALGKRYRALVIDDEVTIVKLQMMLLSSIEVDAFGLSSGEEAIHFLQSRRDIDLVISDIRMPGRVDGLGLFKWLEQNRPDLIGRFVFVTGDSVGLVTGELLNENSIPYVEKPFKVEVYTRTIRQILERCEPTADDKVNVDTLRRCDPATLVL
jgi:signal transduction histidine kinase/FixJ family two-component response regulator